MSLQLGVLARFQRRTETTARCVGFLTKCVTDNITANRKEYKVSSSTLNVQMRPLEVTSE